MKKFSRWFPTKKWIKRLTFLSVLSGLAFVEQINWSRPFINKSRYLECPGYTHCYTLDVGALVSFLLFIICGLLAWSFWDEYQAKKQ